VAQHFLKSMKAEITVFFPFPHLHWWLMQVNHTWVPHLMELYFVSAMGRGYLIYSALISIKLALMVLRVTKTSHWNQDL